MQISTLLCSNNMGLLLLWALNIVIHKQIYELSFEIHAQALGSAIYHNPFYKH